jgi:DNA (cytosine-5)-methyltransferase 1
VAALTANGVGTCGADDNQAQAGHLIVTALTTRAGATFDDQQIGQLVVGILGDQAHTLTAEGHDASEDGTGRGTPIVAFGHTNGVDVQPSETVTPTLRAGHDAMPSVAYGVRGGKPGQGYPAITDGITVRRLTPLECERLQGFPDGWTDGQSDSARYRQLGNSVAVPVLEWVMQRVAAVDARSQDGAA